MSGEMEKYQPQAPMSGNPAHVRLGINQIAVVANYFAESGLFKVNEKAASGRFEARNMAPQECFAIIMAGQALGIGPMPAMMSFHVIEGRPEMSANLQAHFLKASGKYDYRMRFIYKDDEVDACHIDVIDVRSGEIIGESVFTKGMAAKAGLIRERGNWMKYAESMLFARAISNAVAWHAPDSVPMRIYSDGEIGGEKRDAGVQAVAGEGQPSASRVEAMVERAVAEAPAVEEVIHDSEVEIVPPEPNVGAPHDAERDREDVDVQEVGFNLETPGNDRFSPEAVEAKLREDLPKLSTDDREIVKALIVDAGLEFKYSAIVELIVKAGYTDVFSWLRAAQDALSGAAPAPEGESIPAGVTGRQTGSQTATVVSDAQIRMFNAKCGEAGLSEAERKAFLRKFAQVDSSKSIAKADFDELLAALRDIAQGGPETKAAFLGE